MYYKRLEQGRFHPRIFCNHPKQADFYMTFLLVNFAVKNAMFNLNENDRFVMAQHPSDMRIGVNGMCGQVRAVGLDPTNGDVYIFVGSSRKIMKLLHWERGGFAMYYKRLEQGFGWLPAYSPFSSFFSFPLDFF